MKFRRPSKAKPTLMLTSLLDMFTIILIFLIVSYDAEDMDFQLDTKLTLPESSVTSTITPAANVSVSPAGVSIEGHPVAAFQGGAPDAAHVAAKEIPAVVEALEKVRLVFEAEAASRGDEPQEAIVMLQADKQLKYSTLYLVMRSARIAGFSKYRLAVMKR